MFPPNVRCSRTCRIQHDTRHPRSLTPAPAVPAADARRSFRTIDGAEGDAMKLSDIALPNFELSSGQRETLDKYLPLVIVALLVWVAARGFRKIFWTAFGLFWAFDGMSTLRHLVH
jgi:hypothetical protein